MANEKKVFAVRKSKNHAIYAVLNSQIASSPDWDCGGSLGRDGKII